jgi:WD40 repeat protein
VCADHVSRPSLADSVPEYFDIVLACAVVSPLQVQAYVPASSIPHHLVACGHVLVSDDRVSPALHLRGFNVNNGVYHRWLQEEGCLRVWNLNKGVDEPESVLHACHSGKITGIVYIPATSSLVTAGSDAKLRVWSMPSLKMTREFDCGQDAISCLAVFGDYVVSGESLATKRSLPRSHSGSDEEGAVISSPLMKSAPSVPDCAAGLTFWDVTDTWPLAYRIEGAHARHIFAVESVGSSFICSCGDDWKLRIWEQTKNVSAKSSSPFTWTLFNEIDGRYGSFLSMLAVPSPSNEPLLATGGADGRVQVWNVANDWPLVCSLASTRCESSPGYVVMSIAPSCTLVDWFGLFSAALWLPWPAFQGKTVL